MPSPLPQLITTAHLFNIARSKFGIEAGEIYSEIANIKTRGTLMSDESTFVTAIMNLIFEKGEVKGFNEGCDAWVPKESKLKPIGTGPGESTFGIISGRPEKRGHRGTQADLRS